MRYPASEKFEIIRIVEKSHLPVRQTLQKLGIPRGKSWVSHGPHFTAGMISIGWAASMPWKITGHCLGMSGIVSPTRSGVRSSIWRLMSPPCHHESWPSGSLTQSVTLSLNLRFIGFSKPMT